MAQRAETLNPTIEAMPHAAPPLPVQTKNRTHGEPQDMLSTITRLAASKYQSARAGAAHSYRVLLQNSRVRASALKKRFETIRNENRSFRTRKVQIRRGIAAREDLKEGFAIHCSRLLASR